MADDLLQFDADGFLSELSLDAVKVDEHREIDELVHLVAEDSFEEYVYSGSNVVAIVVWTDGGKTTKVREELFSYSSGLVTSIVTIQYDAVGVAVPGETMTEAYSYTGNVVDSVTRTMS
ncbi:MAG TPA: hypothetical protein VMW52_08770 [Phycisphaerae bacterium]|nr:hypothetical protein [Phycisphaerae bacterium]